MTPHAIRLIASVGGGLCLSLLGCSAGDSPSGGLCDPNAAFGPPLRLSGYSFPNASLSSAGFPHFSADELTMYFHAVTSDADPRLHIYTATRVSRSEAFGPPVQLSLQSANDNDSDPYLSPDGLTLWFSSHLPSSEDHLYLARRSSVTDAFASPTLAGDVNAQQDGAYDIEPFVTADNAEIYFTSDRAGPGIWRADVTAAGAGPATQVAELGSTGLLRMPTLSADRLTIYFLSEEEGSGPQAWRAQRTSVDQPFHLLEPADDLNAAGVNYVSWLSSDGCRLYGRGGASFVVATRLD